jgi:hypothetical protein
VRHANASLWRQSRQRPRPRPAMDHEQTKQARPAPVTAVARGVLHIDQEHLGNRPADEEQPATSPKVRAVLRTTALLPRRPDRPPLIAPARRRCLAKATTGPRTPRSGWHPTGGSTGRTIRHPNRFGSMSTASCSPYARVETAILRTTG